MRTTASDILNVAEVKMPNGGGSESAHSLLHTRSAPSSNPFGVPLSEIPLVSRCGSDTNPRAEIWNMFPEAHSCSIWSSQLRGLDNDRLIYGTSLLHTSYWIPATTCESKQPDQCVSLALIATCDCLVLNGPAQTPFQNLRSPSPDSCCNSVAHFLRPPHDNLELRKCSSTR